MSSKIDNKIYNTNIIICRHIDNISKSTRGIISQDILSNLRTYVENIILKIYSCEKDEDIHKDYKNIKSAIEYIKDKGKYKWLWEFHKMLQESVSHYDYSEDNSERLMLKYYEYLLMIKINMKKEYNLDLLENLEKFPLNIDPKLNEYYQKIANEIDKQKNKKLNHYQDKYYVHKIKHFFKNNDIYYEIMFSPLNGYSNKTNRIVAFTNIKIELNYLAKMSFINTSIEVMELKMPILLIINWEICIGDYEFENFIKLFEGEEKKIKIQNLKKINLCSYMTKYKLNLLDIVQFPDSKYNLIKKELMSGTKYTFFDILDVCKSIIKNNKNGKNVLKYLLYTMNSNIIKYQYTSSKNDKLSGLYINNKAIPFDNMPFIFSLVKHNPPITILKKCFDFNDHKIEMLGRYVKNNTELKGILFTNLKDIKEYQNIENLVESYNSKLWHEHKPDNELKIDKGQIFIKKYVNDCKLIIDKLKNLSNQGIANYKNSVNAWLESNIIDCVEKRKIIQNMFVNSTFTIIYGAAGTGKSTLLNHISRFFSNKNKLFLSETNAAIDNLKRKVNSSNCKFMTITKFISNSNTINEYDVLVLDECSTISNSNMIELLKKAIFKVLILVGDTHQIKSIRFGNWFNIAKKFIPKQSLELTKTYRSKNKDLIEFWNRVRKADPKLLELISKCEYSSKLDSSIFEKSSNDEIILCLNYDGLYGINNINRFLQENNPSKVVFWGIQTFKIGDPILFYDTNRFGTLIYNNMKGKILNVSTFFKNDEYDRIEFDIELDRVINGMEVNEEFELLKDTEYMQTKNSVIRFSVYWRYDGDNYNDKTIIPFHISYAISIHKAQGLEYNSVKIILTNEVDKIIDNNIFYTAITRAKSNLKIYWSPEVENKILSSIKKQKDNNKDVELLYKVNL